MENIGLEESSSYTAGQASTAAVTLPYSVRVPLSSLWLPASDAPRPPPAPTSRQSPPTPLTSLTLSRIPEFPARRLVSKGRSGALASDDDVTASGDFGLTFLEGQFCMLLFFTFI